METTVIIHEDQPVNIILPEQDEEGGFDYTLSFPFE
jgi:hypothetical protein